MLNPYKNKFSLQNYPFTNTVKLPFNRHILLDLSMCVSDKVNIQSVCCGGMRISNGNLYMQIVGKYTTTDAKYVSLAYAADVQSNTRCKLYPVSQEFLNGFIQTGDISQQKDSQYPDFYAIQPACIQTPFKKKGTVEIVADKQSYSLYGTVYIDATGYCAIDNTGTLKRSSQQTCFQLCTQALQLQTNRVTSINGVCGNACQLTIKVAQQQVDKKIPPGDSIKHICLTNNSDSLRCKHGYHST